MAEVISVVQFKSEGFAIIEDTKGKYIATKNSLDIIPLYDNDVILKEWSGSKTPCVLLQSRSSMLT